MEDIKKVIADVIQSKRENGPKIPITMQQINNLQRVSKRNRQRLSKYVSKIQEGSLRRKSGSDVQQVVGHTALTKTESDAVITKKRPQMTIKGTRRVYRTSAAPSPSLTSPREDDEWDAVDAGAVRTRTTKGRPGTVPQEYFMTAAEGRPGDDWGDPVCHSDEEEEFFVCRSDNEEDDS